MLKAKIKNRAARKLFLIFFFFFQLKFILLLLQVGLTKFKSHIHFTRKNYKV